VPDGRDHMNQRSRRRGGERPAKKAEPVLDEVWFRRSLRRRLYAIFVGVVGVAMGLLGAYFESRPVAWSGGGLVMSAFSYAALNEISEWVLFFKRDAGKKR